jgi:hypothetical protein
VVVSILLLLLLPDELLLDAAADRDLKKKKKKNEIKSFLNEKKTKKLSVVFLAIGIDTFDTQD